MRSRSQNGQDVTQEFVSAEDRLQAARAERRSLLRRLENADSDAEAESIRRRLDLNAGEIRGLRAQVRELRTRTDYAAVSVSLDREGEDGGGATGGDGARAARSTTPWARSRTRSRSSCAPWASRSRWACSPPRWPSARAALRRRRREAALT